MPHEKLFRQFQAIDLVPAAAGEIRNLHRLAAVCNGSGSKLTQAGPLCGIVDVHIERLAVTQTPHKSVIHDEIHSAVSADLAGLFLNFLGNSMFLLCHQGVTNLARRV